VAGDEVLSLAGVWEHLRLKWRDFIIPFGGTALIQPSSCESRPRHFRLSRGMQRYAFLPPCG
jgi:hypothetical protein